MKTCANCSTPFDGTNRLCFDCLADNQYLESLFAKIRKDFMDRLVMVRQDADKGLVQVTKEHQAVLQSAAEARSAYKKYYELATDREQEIKSLLNEKCALAEKAQLDTDEINRLRTELSQLQHHAANEIGSTTRLANWDKLQARLTAAEDQLKVKEARITELTGEFERYRQNATVEIRRLGEIRHQLISERDAEKTACMSVSNQLDAVVNERDRISEHLTTTTNRHLDELAKLTKTIKQLEAERDNAYTVRNVAFRERDEAITRSNETIIDRNTWARKCGDSDTKVLLLQIELETAKENYERVASANKGLGQKISELEDKVVKLSGQDSFTGKSARISYLEEVVVSQRNELKALHEKPADSLPLIKELKSHITAYQTNEDALRTTIADLERRNRVHDESNRLLRDENGRLAREVEGRRNDHAKMTNEIKQLKEERDNYRLKWENLGGMNNNLEKQNTELREKLSKQGERLSANLEELRTERDEAVRLARLREKDRNDLQQELNKALNENQRLKAGQFTPEELQTLCHTVGEGASECDFKLGCEEYQRRLFGKGVIEEIKGLMVAILEKYRKYIPEGSYTRILAEIASVTVGNLNDEAKKVVAEQAEVAVKIRGGSVQELLRDADAAYESLSKACIAEGAEQSKSAGQKMAEELNKHLKNRPKVYGRLPNGLTMISVLAYSWEEVTKFVDADREESACVADRYAYGIHNIDIRSAIFKVAGLIRERTGYVVPAGQRPGSFNLGGKEDATE